MRLRCWILLIVVAAAARVSAQSYSNDLFLSAITDSPIHLFCQGVPVCRGEYDITFHRPECSNAFVLTNSFSMTGMVAQDAYFAHPTEGSIVFNGLDFTESHNADGSCSFASLGDLAGTYSLAAPGSAVLEVRFVDGRGNIILAHARPLSGGPPGATGFGSSVEVAERRISIDGSTASASATLEVRPADVGQESNIYVFALAPPSLVKNARATGPTDEPASCVLAQLDPASNQLVAVSASTLQAYLTAVLRAQGQGITLLNRVPIGGIAGATFFVGYGRDPGTMIGNWLNRNVVTIPGGTSCPSVMPATPGSMSGLWWKADESGWGVHFTQRRNLVFAVWYTYDQAGKPKWFVASNCTFPAHGSACQASLYESRYEANRSILSIAGTLALDFGHEGSVVMSYATAAGSRQVALSRQPIASAAAPKVDYTDLWWNPLSPGWGLAMAHQGDVVFLAWFFYDSGGNSAWYVASRCELAADKCTAPLYRTTGPAPAATFDPAQVHALVAGSMSLRFLDANNALLEYELDGVKGSVVITRQLF